MERRQNNQDGQPNGSSSDQSQQWNTNQRDSTNNNDQNGSQKGQSGQSGQSDNNSGQTSQQSQGQQSQTETGQQGQQTSGTSQQGSNNQQNSNSNGQSSSFGQQGSNNNFGGTPTVGSAPTQTLILLVQSQSSSDGNQGGTFGGGIATASPLPTGNNQNGQQGGNDQNGQQSGQNSQGGDGSRGGNDSNGNDSNRGGNGSNNDNNGNDGNDRGNGDDNNNNRNQQYDNNRDDRQDGGGISDGTVKGIAIGASVGGVLILAIIFYIFWRRRKGASFSQIARFKSPSNSTILSPPAGNDNMTTLPIYRNDRFSVRSSRHDSVTNMANSAAARPPAAQRSPLSGPEAWKSSHPPKVGSPEALQAFNEANRQLSPPLSHPQQAHMAPQERSSSTMMDLPVMKESNAHNPGLGLFARHSTDLSGASDNEWPLKGEGDSPEDTQNPDRWSWSNSNAPPTPRIVPPNARASLQSYPGGASLAAWLRNQREDPPVESAGNGNKPLLKNQATQPPVLSPEVPARKGSKKYHAKKGSHGHGLTGMFKPNNHSKNQQPSKMETWTPPKGADSPRPSTNINGNTTIEMTEKM